MRKYVFYYFSLLITLVVASCAELTEPVTLPSSMTLERHDVTLMVGDLCVIHPVFIPDSLSNNTVFWMTDNPEVATFIMGDTLLGVSPGKTNAIAIAVTDYNKIDTCAVEVIERWTLPEEDFPHETIVYANVVVHGEPATDDHIIAAFIGGEVRGIGEMFEMRGHSVMRIRIHGDFVEPDEMDVQSVTLRCYTRSKHLLETFDYWLYFDGETHGTPSAPVRLEIR